MATMTGAGPVWSQEPRTPSKFPTWLPGSQTPELSFASFLETPQGTVFEEEKPAHKPGTLYGCDNAGFYLLIWEA